jgi:hypothetical protein
MPGIGLDISADGLPRLARMMLPVSPEDRRSTISSLPRACAPSLGSALLYQSERPSRPPNSTRSTGSSPQPGPAPSPRYSTASTAERSPGRIRIDEAFRGKLRAVRAGRVLDVAGRFG